MKQILHIFAKDTRRFWPEILASLAILAALVIVCSHLWSLPQSTQWLRNEIEALSLKLMFTGQILCAGIVVSWWILITRVIHAERLVGETQFWTTRPYEWKRLLAAKLCFLAAFLYAPLVLAQVLMLASAGLNPLGSISGMLFNLMLITGMYVLPLMAIAAVTSNFFRATLTLFIVLAGIAPFAVKDIFNPGMPMDTSFFLFLIGGYPLSHLLPTGDQLSLALLSIAVCGTAIVLLYALRRPWIARITLLAAPVILCIAVLTVPSHPDLYSPAQLNLHYPPLPAGDAGPVQLSDGRDENHLLVVHRDAPSDDFIWVKVPLLLSPIQEDSAVDPENLEATVTNASGFSWSTKVGLPYPDHFLPASSNRSGSWPEQRRRVSFQIPLAVYEKFKSVPVTVRFTLALAELHAAKVTRIPFPIHEVTVPEVGICRALVFGYGMIRCKSAFRQPQLTYVSADWSQTPCPAPQTEMKQVRGETWMGFSDSEPADLSIVPVQYSWGAFMPDHNNPTGGKYLCTGTPITFTQYKLVRRTQTSLTIPDMQLTLQQ